MEAKKKVKKMAFGGMASSAARGVGTAASIMGLSKPASAPAKPAPAPAKPAPAPAKPAPAKPAPAPAPKNMMGLIGQGAARAAMGARPLFKKDGGTVAAKTKTRAKAKK